ncbi:MAG: mechanosensitive ion channel family protein [Nannocystaceae bacterium]|nr:mechanosensitive ion channel family protein [Nannocystaceae bacterium]
MTFTDRLIAEITAIQDRLDARLVLYVALLFALVWVIRRALLSGTRIIWRLGWDRTRRLARLRSISDITLIAVLTLLVLRKLVLAAPIITWLSVAVLLLAVAIALPTWVRDFTAGVALANRTRFREGDQVRLPSAVGSVRHIGLLRTAIRAGDGGTLSVPNREVLAQTIQVGREQQAAPVEIVLPTEAAASPEGREMLLRLAHVSPFRRGGSRPTLTESDRGWVLAVQTWSTRDVDGARRALERQLLGSPGKDNA